MGKYICIHTYLWATVCKSGKVFQGWELARHVKQMSTA